MNATMHATECNKDSAYRTDGAANDDGATGPEPRVEFYGYPFICGFSMWTDDDSDTRS